MSSTNKTSLGLNMWEASDKPVRQDFVNDNAIINEKITKLNSDLNNQDIVSTGLSLTWGTITYGGYSVIGNLVIINIRIEVRTTLNATGADYAIFGFPLMKAAALNTISVSCSRNDLTRSCYMNTHGVLNFVPSTTVSIGTAILFSAFYIKQ